LRLAIEPLIFYEGEMRYQTAFTTDNTRKWCAFESGKKIVFSAVKIIFSYCFTINNIVMKIKLNAIIMIFLGMLMFSCKKENAEKISSDNKCVACENNPLVHNSTVKLSVSSPEIQGLIKSKVGAALKLNNDLKSGYTFYMEKYDDINIGIIHYTEFENTSNGCQTSKEVIIPYDIFTKEYFKYYSLVSVIKGEEHTYEMHNASDDGFISIFVDPDGGIKIETKNWDDRFDDCFTAQANRMWGRATSVIEFFACPPCWTFKVTAYCSYIATNGPLPF
jgi:hypothetical protein